MTGAPRLMLRPAGEADCRMLFDWANDPAVRASSFVEEQIPWERHREWFAARLRDPACLHYVITTPEGDPIGQARFEIGNGREAVIAVSIAAAWRGKGHGTEAIRLATEQACRHAGLTLVRAFIRPENTASVRAFSKAGFSAPIPIRYNGRPALCMTRG